MVEISAGISKTLKALGLISEQTTEIFSSHTRDHQSLAVYRDAVSGVIFIDDFFVGEQAYSRGQYREKTRQAFGAPELERYVDTDRRVRSLSSFIVGKNIVDFGCGPGNFLMETAHLCASSIGVELQVDLIEGLRSQGFHCETSIEDVSNESVDSLFAFHSFEHLPDPLEQLNLMKNKISIGGSIIVEVPHANDFLLHALKSEAFKEHTLWSQHLILHTRHSLHRFLDYVGFKNILIRGVQRYPLSNHLWWLSEGNPGGHKKSLAIIDNLMTKANYESALQSIDATDTLLAIATST